MQGSLFGREERSFDRGFAAVRRLELSEGAWLEHQPGWLSGHATLFEWLVANVDWKSHEREMYERIVAVPRLTASMPEGAAARGGAWRELTAISEVLSRRYGKQLTSIGFAYYRDGNDSVAPHGDKMEHLVGDTVIAIVSVGSPRRFTLSKTGGAKTEAREAEREARRYVFNLGWGDLLVMGGNAQQTWQHGVPKVAYAQPRISIVFREPLTSSSFSERLAQARSGKGDSVQTAVA